MKYYKYYKLVVTIYISLHIVIFVRQPTQRLTLLLRICRETLIVRETYQKKYL